jgi:CHASE3 domain sensor protein
MKKFFNNMEERFVFPIGRRSWQVLSLIGLVVLALSILYFLLNATPTSRDSVNVSKSEVIENKVDTSITVVNSPSTCPQEDYNSWVDTLKKDLPNSEWLKLGDSSEPYSDYAKDEYGNYIQDEYGDYAMYEKRNFNKNPLAIPNVLEDLFTKRGYDSSMICEKVEFIKMLHFLNKKVEKNYLVKEGFFDFAYGINELPSVSLSKLEDAFELRKAILLSDKIIKDKEELYEAWQYISYIVTNSVSDQQIDIAISTIKEHAALKDKTYPASKYFDIAKLVFDSNLGIDDLSTAVRDFNEDLAYYDKNDLYKSFKRYLKLYNEKVEMAEEKKSLKTMEKALNRVKSLTFAGGAFLSIVAIASILLLFSIQSLLKSHINKDK